jgi:hypothetical protein
MNFAYIYIMLLISYKTFKIKLIRLRLLVVSVRGVWCVCDARLGPAAAAAAPGP